MVGSFLNVVIHRLPKMLEREWRAECAELAAEAADAGPPPAAADTYNLVRPRSACPACGAPIKAWHNVPVVSWLLLRGRCAACRAPISPRYPIVEAATAVAFALVAWRFGFGVESACALLVTAFLIAMTVIDFDTQLLPDLLTLPLMWAGLLAAAWLGRGAGPLPVDLRSAVLGAAFGYLSLWSIYRLHKLITGREGMGYGDFKLLAALGAWLGWQQLVPIVLLSAGTGAVLGIGLIVARRLGREVPIAFGPFLAIAGWLVMVFSPMLVAPWWSIAR
jgi:leader peptidase (prepilin peptidase)/N-methyltransferase